MTGMPQDEITITRVETKIPRALLAEIFANDETGNFSMMLLTGGTTQLPPPERTLPPAAGAAGSLPPPPTHDLPPAHYPNPMSDRPITVDHTTSLQQGRPMRSASLKTGFGLALAKALCLVALVGGAGWLIIWSVRQEVPVELNINGGNS